MGTNWRKRRIRSFEPALRDHSDDDFGEVLSPTPVANAFFSAGRLMETTSCPSHQADERGSDSAFSCSERVACLILLMLFVEISRLRSEYPTSGILSEVAGLRFAVNRELRQPSTVSNRRRRHRLPSILLQSETLRFLLARLALLTEVLPGLMPRSRHSSNFCLFPIFARR